MQQYHQRVALVSSTGSHVRSVHAELARSLVTYGIAKPDETRGRIRSLTLLSPASSHASRTGPASEVSHTVRFHRWLKLELSAARIVEHHPRCLDYEL